VKVKRLALLHSLADKAQNGRIFVIEKFEFSEPKTKKMAELLEKIGLKKEKTLLLSSEYNRNLYLSGRNIPFCNVLEVKDANPIAILNSNYVVVEKDGLNKLETRLAI
jgi:large subunit ribosomal protein L4